MMPTAETREATISLPFAPHAVLERFEAVEALSELFEIEAYVISPEDIDFFHNLGASVTITVRSDGEHARTFNGHMWDAQYVNLSSAGVRYRLTLRPWLYELTRNADFNIFQGKNALDIIKKVFETRGCSDIDYTKLSGSFESREYCVQYGESDFTFVSRLMEQEGIYYFFRHEDGKHTLVLANGRTSHAESHYGSLPFIGPTGGVQTYAARFWEWNEHISSGVEGQVRLRDWDFKQPAIVESTYEQGNKLKTEKAVVYQNPGRFLTTSLGNERAQVILESARRQRQSYFGVGDAPILACGDRLTITRHDFSRLNKEYILTGLRYRVANQHYRSGHGELLPTQVDVVAIPADTPWRAPFLTPWPVAKGPETAVVTGPAGEEIWTDPYGRVMVRFHWDHSDTPNDKSTCFMRVSFSSAGDSFGHVILPRIGQEVIVDFLDGDPDRPLITGRVYNNSHDRPYTLPEHKGDSTWRSNTIGQTGQDYDGAESGFMNSSLGYNEITMRDDSGKEQLYFYAQRDRTNLIGRDDKFRLGRDEHRRTGRDRKIEVKNNDSHTVEEGDETHVVQKGKRSTTIQQDESLTVNQGNMSITVSQGNSSTDITQGNYTLKTDAGSVKITAQQQIVLTVGQNSITIDQNGVTINGLNITSQAQISLKATALMTDVEGSAMTTIKGGIVMIN